MARGVVKYDMVYERELAYVNYGEFYGGEALFVPRKNGPSKDNGYLLELLMTADRAELLIIDATSMQEMTRLHLPQRVPFGVRVCWLNQEKVASLARSSDALSAISQTTPTGVCPPPHSRFQRWAWL